MSILKKKCCFKEMAKYITFKLIEEKPKTKVYGVFMKTQNFCLGKIKWYAQWHRYAFFPASDTIYENICLRDIAEFIEKLMKERKK